MCVCVCVCGEDNGRCHYGNMRVLMTPEGHEGIDGTWGS